MALRLDRSQTYRPSRLFFFLRYPVITAVARQIIAYYILTVMEQDDGAEVQRVVKELYEGRVSGVGAVASVFKRKCNR